MGDTAVGQDAIIDELWEAPDFKAHNPVMLKKGTPQTAADDYPGSWHGP